MPPDVSVVIPTHNRAEAILPAVRSVLRQSLEAFELIVVDDRSDDDTVDRLKTVADPRLRVVAHERNLGASAARNTGVREARGRWIAFQDSDDEWLPGKLEAQMAALRARPEAVACFCGLLILGRAEDEAKPAARAKGRTAVAYHPPGAVPDDPDDFFSELLGRSLVSTQTLVARRHLLLELGGFDEALPALIDWDCALRLARHGPFAFVDEPLVLQRFSENSITRSRLNRARARMRLVEKNMDVLRARPKTLARHCHAIGGAWRDLGDFTEARRWLVRAVRAAPARPLGWLALSHAALLGLSSGRAGGGGAPS